MTDINRIFATAITKINKDGFIVSRRKDKYFVSQIENDQIIWQESTNSIVLALSLVA